MKVIFTEIAVCTWTSRRICVARLTANFLAILKIPFTKGLLVSKYARNFIAEPPLSKNVTSYTFYSMIYYS